MSFLLLVIPASVAQFPAFKRNSQRAAYVPKYRRIRAKQHVITLRYRSTLFLLNIILHIRKICVVITNSYNAYV